jgi:ribonuclease P protein component
MKIRSEALPGVARITKKEDFQRARKEGSWRRGNYFDFVLTRSPAGQSRVGLIIPLHAHTAVERNRLKRRAREVMRRYVLPAEEEARDIVVKARKNAYGLSFDSIKEELERLSCIRRE